MPTPAGLPTEWGERAYSRAYGRAMRQLKQQHRDEFDGLLLAELPKAKAEIDQLVAAGHSAGSRLRRGNVCPSCGVDAATLTAGMCSRCGAPDSDRGRCVVDRPDIGKRFVLDEHAFPPRRSHRARETA